MRKLLGYCAHKASVRLHEVAVGCFGVQVFQQNSPLLCTWTSDGLADGPYLRDVAPRLAATIDAVRDRVQHATWLASILGMGRIGWRR